MTATSLSGLITRIEKNAGEASQLPVENWQPERLVEVDLKIDAKGHWYHEGQPFTRTSLVRLFSTLLRKEEDGNHYLVTPVEKVRVEVEDAPFLVILAEREGEGETARIRLQTNVSDEFWLDAEHPLEIRFTADDEPRPYVRVRGRLEARLLPQVYYQLVGWAEAREEATGETCMLVTSCGQEFSLGCYS
ncbi:hypothetical protein SAMN05660443_0889 [Marinospirillum celere]|uniref:DUF1285 domain-containing protein n=1 Tax=Marinospirillum celere TaxID=1122252 RepID=A0A1I1EVP5_9GAMM|nr:DUF1285 domain-containing protein [Marinospirillum celere]SFB91215.1 hypothetical protein SAMN05660443_0889 [Marinospirillum celere]